MLVTPKTVNSIREISFLGEMEEILKAQKKKQNKLKRNWAVAGEVRMI